MTKITTSSVMTTLKALCFFIAILLVAPFLQSSATAQTSLVDTESMDCSVPKNTQSIRPGPIGEKTKVKFGFYLIDVKEIDDVEQTFTADIVFNTSWKDPRLSKKSLGRSLENCVIKIQDIWYPTYLDVNRRKGEKLLPFVVNVDSEGNVNHKQRYIGTLSSDLHFGNFPFDDQVLHFIMAAFGPDAEYLEFEQDDKLTGARGIFSIEGWDVELLEAVSTSEVVNSAGTDEVKHFARIDFRLSADRDRNYYVLNVIIPLCLIVLMAWAVFWIPPTAIGPQVGLSTATVFTLIAYRFSLSYQLPRVSYFTRIDKFVLFSTILVFIALGAAIVTSKIATDGNEERAMHIEKWARYIYLLAFGLILTYALFI